jgi:enoyl-[acyl-carrier protein] reductase I
MAADEMNLPKGELMKGKKGLIMGVANHNSIAWAIAAQLAAQGAEIAFTYIEAMEKRVKPLGESIGVTVFAPCEVTDDASMDAAFKTIEEAFGTLDFVVHAIAFSDKNELKGSFVDNTTRENFARSMDISAYSFVDTARRASKLMPNGGSMITLTYLGSERVIPNYNVMGVAKAALEACTRYIARDLGPKGIRVNAISAGAIRTLSLAGISGGRSMIGQGRAWSPLREDTAPEGVAGCALWLLSDLGRSTTGEVVHVDAGFHIVGLPDDLEGGAA